MREYDRAMSCVIITLAVTMCIHMIATTVRGNERQQGKQAETSAWPMGESTQMTQTDDGQQETWQDIGGFVYHDIPEEYQRAGGCFPEELQMYTYALCQQYGVDYSLIVAMIEQESGYVFDKVGDDGNSFGYMQVYETAHTDRMERLHCTDITDPYQNVQVGIDYMAGLIGKYGTVRDALAAYNYGERGAREHLWNNGIYVYSYNEAIMSRAKELEEEWGNGEAG
jgi:hypothetical protein